MADDGEERRGAERERAFIGAELLLGSGDKRMAIVRDCSETGVQFYTPLGIDKGERVEADVFLEEDAPMRVAGQVVRAVQLETFDGPWRWCVAIVLDQPCPELVDRAAAIRAHQEALYGGSEPEG